MARSSTTTLVTRCVVALLLLGQLPTHAASNCKDHTEAYYLANGEDYRGHVNVTETGLPCQKWSAQSPNAHEIELDPARGIGDHNYCRNPNGLERPGCFTTQPGGAYQLCNVGDVCTDYPVAKATVLFSPPSGTTLVKDGSQNYVSVSCYPRPCSVHYALGAESLASTSSPLLATPLLLPSSTTVKVYAVFQNAEAMRVQASYTVTPTTTPAPPAPLQFVPTDAALYEQPILVELQGATAYDHVLMYWNDDFMNPTLYNGSFWLKSSTLIQAVVNGTYFVSASYRLNVTAPPLYVYPRSGRYVGGVSVLVRDPQPPSNYYIYVNDTTAWEALTDLLFTWTAPGTSSLDIRALHVHGLESRARVVYEVVEARPPTISPDPSVAYSRPVNVTCASPVSAPVLLYVYRDATMTQTVAEGVYSVVLRTPGTFTVTCGYVDDLGATHTATAALEMVAAPMQSPSFRPECGAKFPAVPLSLQTQLDLSLLLPGAQASAWSVYGSATHGSRIPMITRSSESEGLFTYDLFPGSLPAKQPTVVTVSMTAHSQDPLESNSPVATCAYTLYPLGSAATPYFSARPACATTTAPVSAACITALQVQLAGCLHFYSAELLSVTPVGPFVAMRMTGLADAVRPDMYFRMGWCLAAMQEQQVLFELHNETSNDLVLAASWHVATPVRKATHVFTGLPVTAHIEGFHARAGSYHMVRSTYNCEDIGVVPEAFLPGSPYAAAAAAPVDDGSAWIIFRFPVAGAYKLCAYVGDALYTVPFSASPSGVLSEAWAPSDTAYLDVLVQPFPDVAALPAADCGGLIPPPMEHTPLAVSFAAFPSGAFSALSYSHDNGGWATATLPVDAATKATGAVAVAVGPLSAPARPVQVLDTTLGPTTGASHTCVFFVSAASPVTRATAVTYVFYTVNTTAVPAGSTGVMLLLQGVFQPSELIVIDVYDVRTPRSASSRAVTPPSSLLERIRRVTARASAATAYTFALPDAVLGLPAGARAIPFVIHATLDGVQVTAVPSTVALSPLSLAMTSCTTCASGLCYNGACVCKNRKTKVVHLCGDGEGSGDSDSSSSVPSVETTTTTTTSAPDDDLQPASVGERLGFLLIYLGLLGAVAGYILISIRRSSARRVNAVQAEMITVEPA
ncbi:hypothetical protein ABB37_05285 [Leptomonas pyrrhocoris]|uniref:Kringle domain-containing protein n=1 Tax=Leptomonas pyrrhocoris TaxID=157538 RepID=A0A0M9G039_LEPPY|nr:hypothetical protein ABB37_05285 [Leptomonas pyrrhocoris]KPA79447.1 hypothetical protein ABB37_05285 [Leptomonas pyrrhocoris]|eukprot:XP_015657886.1 hypothetical protein ABB37_05285 [Leptomonas pyrrhocoris]